MAKILSINEKDMAIPNKLYFHGRTDWFENKPMTQSEIIEAISALSKVLNYFDGKAFPPDAKQHEVYNAALRKLEELIPMLNPQVETPPKNPDPPEQVRTGKP